MTKDRNNPQLEFWRGQFGQDYTRRHEASAERLQACVSLWGKILDCIAGEQPNSILEVGSNIGINLRALRALTGAEMYAIEPNHEALRRLVDDGVVPVANAMEGRASSIPLADAAVDLVFTSGVLIHVHPDDLLASMREIHRVARRHVVCIEYFSDRPETIRYRGHEERLFKCDFGGVYLDSFRDLRVIDYGFAWKRVTDLDNVTWWVLRKDR